MVSITIDDLSEALDIIAIMVRNGYKPKLEEYTKGNLKKAYFICWDNKT